MSFQEKSSWGLLLGIGVVAFFYFPAAFEIVGRVSHGAPLIGISIAGVIAIVVIESTYHAIIAGGSDDQTDERDRLIDMKSERFASYALVISLFWLVGHIIITHAIEGLAPMPGLEIAVWILLALTASEVVKLIAQITQYRLSA